MEREGSLPRLQQPATGPYPEPVYAIYNRVASDTLLRRILWAMSWLRNPLLLWKPEVTHRVLEKSPLFSLYFNVRQLRRVRNDLKSRCSLRYTPLPVLRVAVKMWRSKWLATVRDFADSIRFTVLIKVVPVLLFLTEHHAMKAYWASGGIAARILWPRH
jgi:hypothetical protein